MRKIILGSCLLLVVGLAAYWRARSQRPLLGVAYAGENKVVLWSTTALVREPVATLVFGDRLEMLKREGSSVEVRTEQGITGWIDARALISSDLWQQAQKLLERAKGMPVEARGHTKVVSNLRVEPGRDGARIRQFGREVPLALLERRVVEMRPAPTADEGEPNAGEENGPKPEDWWLVLAQPKEGAAVAGWVLGRFIDLDLPSPLPDYASTAGLRVVAWFALNQVADRTGGPKTQYLLVGTRGGDGQPCDFSTLRVYTWAVKHQRYETAYVESGLCGQLPVISTPPASPGGDVYFRFKTSGANGEQGREYRMRQTIVRRIREGGSGARSM